MSKKFLKTSTLISCVLILLVFSDRAFSQTVNQGQESSERPNIIIVLSDDMGYSDVGSYGGGIETPTLDSLAMGGLRFTQFYNTARCVPTRASLLTGLYQHQTGLGHMTGDDNLPGYRGDLNKHSLTIAQVLSNAGYSTYMSGKWHVTPFQPDSLSRHNWPLQRGFERFFGTIPGAGSYFDPAGLVRQNNPITPSEALQNIESSQFYYTTAISEYASKFVREHEEKRNSPFFMYVSYTAPHWPLHAPEESIRDYRGEFDSGWDKLREERYARMKEMGVIKDDWDLTERDPEVPAWEDADDKEWETRRMEVYAAQIDLMDQGIGRIVSSLKETGEFENTLIMFLHDNGGDQENLEWIEWKDAGEHSGVEPPGNGEMQTEIFPKVTRGGNPIQHGNMEEYMPGARNTYQSYARPWANVSNTPFREYKHLVHEGGIATPLIAHWPEGIARAGEFERQPGHLVDLMATAVDLAGASYPESYRGNKIHPMQGASLRPAFQGKNLERQKPLFFEHEGNRALRDGRWKIVAEGPTGEWELYDMKNDRTETRNLASEKPELLERMVEKWVSLAHQYNAIPWPHEGKFEAEQDADR